jgi:hypothetical protein
MPKIIFQAEIDVDQINPNYFCTDQTSTTQRLTTRNFYDSANIDLYLPNTEIVIGSCFYTSVNCQASEDFQRVVQSVDSLLTVNYEDIIGSFSTRYPVVDSEYLNAPAVSNLLTTSGVFSPFSKKNVYITQSPNKESRVLFILYDNE